MLTPDARRAAPFSFFLSLVFALMVAPGIATAAAPNAADSGDATFDFGAYAVQPGYDLTVDTPGFFLPTAIAFVPEPGDAPDDPLYFVTELRGTVKVVTNDRSVHEFARVPAERDQDPDLGGTSQSGLAGICLAPDDGYVFVTYTEADAGGVLRNRIARFDAEPGSFGLTATATRRVGTVLDDFQSAPAHQIGNCVVVDDQLIVGVGDGGNSSVARDRDVLLGKVLCFDVEGGPCTAEGNEPPAEPALRDFVYAYGFRNPFGLWWEDGLYTAENGVDLDRFLRVERGEDHLWRGTDQSLAARAELVFTPVISPVQLARLGADAEFVAPAWRGCFVAGVYGSDGETSAGVVAFGSDGCSIPTYLLEHVGEREQHLAAAAIGPDGIYTAPMVPGASGTSPVLKIALAPDDPHDRTVVERAGLESMGQLGVLASSGCVGCHAIGGKGGGIGPTLDEFGIRWRLTERLNAPGYAEQVARVDALDEAPFTRWREARQEVLEAEGLERTWVWLGYFLQEPRFDRPETQMPDLGLSAEQAAEARERLFAVTGVPRQASAGEGVGGFVARGISFVERNTKAVALGAVAGGGAVVALVVAFALLLWWRRS